MQIKSWQIALIGTIIQVSVIIAIPLIQSTKGVGNDSVLGIGMGLIFGFIYSVIGAILVLLLYFSKTQKIGAKISIILGVGSLLFFINDSGLSAITTLCIQGIFLITASIYYFWKKV